MLEHSVYSVISPEGCAAILWKDAARKKDAAEALKLTAYDLKAFGVVDEIVPEPPGGAHADPASAAAAVGEAVERNLREIADLTPEERRERRYRRFRALGQFEGIEPGPHLSGARRRLSHGRLASRPGIRGAGRGAGPGLRPAARRRGAPAASRGGDGGRRARICGPRTGSSTTPCC